MTLDRDGDSFERRYYGRFLEDQFPSYERFWLNFVVPMTNRPENIHFKTDGELGEMNRGDHELCIAQLHYSVFRNLARVFDVKSLRPLNMNGLTEGMVRLVGAQDVAFELLGRYLNLEAYDPWLSTDGRKARQWWQKREDYPLQDIRDYRNNLVHGRILPSITDEDCYVPRIGVEDRYFDWRLITANNPDVVVLNGDFIVSNAVLESAWLQTINYIEARWRDNLV